MKAILNIVYTPASPVPLTGITIEGSVAGGCTFRALINLIPGNNTTPAISCDVDLPVKVVKDNMSIQWSYKLRGGTSMPIVTTSHERFVTIAAPLSSTLVSLTALTLATKNPGATTPVQALNNTWAAFSTGTAPANITGWDTRKLKYYPAGDPGTGGTRFGDCATSSRSLLMSTTGAGACASFASSTR